MIILGLLFILAFVSVDISNLVRNPLCLQTAVTPSLGPFFAIATASTGVGYAFLIWLGGLKRRSIMTLLLAPLAGLITVGCLLAVAAAVGLSSRLLTGFVIAAAVYPGFLWMRKALRRRRLLAPSWSWGVAFLVCCYYVLPFTGNGRLSDVRAWSGESCSNTKFVYLDVDPVYNAAVTSVLMRSSPPHEPGRAAQRLYYHYASHSIAAAFAKLFGLTAADGLLALQASFFLTLIPTLVALGRILFPRNSLSGMAVAVTILFGGAVLVYRLGVRYVGLGVLESLLGDFLDLKMSRLLIHYQQFHSLVWTAAGIPLAFSLLALKNRSRLWAPPPAALLSAMMISFNFVAGAALCGATGAALLFGRRRNRAVSLGALIVLGATLFLLFGGGYLMHRTASTDLDYAAALAGQFGIPLAQRLFQPWYKLLATNLGYIFLNFPLAIWLFCRPIAVPSRLKPLRLAAAVWMIGCLLAALLLRSEFNVALYATVNLQIMAMVLNAVAIVVLWREAGKSRLKTAVVGAASLWALIAFGWMLKPTMLQREIRIRPALASYEWKGLARLDALAPQDALIATNAHDLPIVNGVGTSYRYSAVAGRRFFVEGYRFGERRAAGFERDFQDNRVIFESTDPDSVMNALSRNSIEYILCQPLTDLAVAGNLPARLKPVPWGCPMKLYRAEGVTD